MRYLFISDIHSNFVALQSVLVDAATQGFDQLVCLGDITGYGPKPNECVQRLSDFDAVVLAGNHDWGVVGKTDLYIFNGEAREALLWTRDTLTETNLKYIAGLPISTLIGPDILICHGSPREPVWEYVVDEVSARENFDMVQQSLIYVGHSHIPLAFYKSPEGSIKLQLPGWNPTLPTGMGRYIINPGSVGQPRDGDPRASYGILDTDTQEFSFHRAEYAVTITQEQMRAYKLPRRMIERLSVGR